MAHERICSENVAGNLIIAWNDDGDVVSIGIEWDDPDAPDPATSDAAPDPSAGDVNCEPADGPAEPTNVLERSVEYSLGGRIEVPYRTEAYRLRPYRDAEGRWSIYLHFNRPTINNIVRTVRRARNKAFGADE